MRGSPPVGVKARFPGFIEPALATLMGRVPSGDRWIHEIKFDGYRVQVHIANSDVKVFTRRGHDWTHRFRKIAHDAFQVKAETAIIDGEVVVPAADGTTDFSVLQNELKGRSTKIVMVAFDLLYLDGRDLRAVPLFERKALLRKIISGTDIQFSESFEIDGHDMFKHACKTGLEGVVSKVRDGRYESGRGNVWIKATCAQRETLAIAGYALDVPSGMACTSAVATAVTSCTPGKSITASRLTTPKNYSENSSLWYEEPNPTQNALRIAAFGSNRSFWPKSNIVQRAPKGSCGMGRMGGKATE